MATFNFKLSQLYPGSGEHRINTCANPDCLNFGVALTGRDERVEAWKAQHPDASPEKLGLVAANGPGAYKLGGADKKHARVSQAFHYQDRPHAWVDQRTVRCQGQTRDGKVCNSAFSLLSPAHLEEEVARLRNHNGVLDGPSCGACGTRYLERPDEFSLNGVHQRTKDRAGQPLKRPATPKSVRVLHKPCKGQKGARFAISLPHANQKKSSDNVHILGALLNSAGVWDLKRMLGGAATGRKMGMSRIYDRIRWLEGVFLAYEREMLRRWRKKVEASGEAVEHRLSHDDLVLTTNWESSSDRRNTQLNCAVTADAGSGYVYRVDVDFDPRVAPLDLFNSTYLDEERFPRNLIEAYSGTAFEHAPKFSWQRPTGRLHEPQFFFACAQELRVFKRRVLREMPAKTEEEIAARQEILNRVDSAIKDIRVIAEDWFGFSADGEPARGSFKGMTTRDIYTKAAHFILLKEMLPDGHIVLTTEQEATLPSILPHVFDKEIREDRFAWLAISIKKDPTQPEIQRKNTAYNKARHQFRQEGLGSGRFDRAVDDRTVTEAFIADHLSAAFHEGTPRRPFHGSNYRSSLFPQLWVRSVAHSHGELDKVVGFPILPRYIRWRTKQLPFDAAELGKDLREDLAPFVYKATLQPASTFMNALRTRLSMADRAGSGGARVAGSYIQGAVFNPATLISLINIFRVQYNFFEPRPYASPYEDVEILLDAPRPRARSLRYPGTSEYIGLPAKIRKTPHQTTPAMRHGMDAVTRRKDGTEDVPDLYRVIYRPWLYAGTKVGTKLDRTSASARNANKRTSDITAAGT
ncbi:MAG: hypothetical protein ACU0E9_13055 [Limimaricola soesokkakensis]|uniref:hypothetical protein n=1 Tax=Limimaricola soesokkakensis TaxID=1343159 RepID=UPI004059017B